MMNVIKTVGAVIAIIAALATTICNVYEMKNNNENENAVIAVARETEENATVIIRTADGNVYEFSGDNYKIANDHVTVFFE